MTSQSLALINRAGGLYRRILTEVVSTDRRPSIKPGTWNIPEHAGTFRNIPEHPGTSNNYNNYEKYM